MMHEIFSWSQSLCLGNEVVDSEHRHLFEIANRAVLIWDGDRQHLELNAVLDELHEYVRTHFEHEEELMKELGYPELEEHRVQHQAIVAAMARATDPSSEGNVVIDLRALMTEWIASHVQEEDMRIRDWAQRPSEPGLLQRFLNWRRREVEA